MKSILNIFITLFLLICASQIGFAQNIQFNGPTSPVQSGTIVTFSATGETSNTYIGSVPIDGGTNWDSPNPGLRCQLSDTYYYRDTNQASKFNYTLTNTNSVAKTVNLAFNVLIVSFSANGTLTTTNKLLRYSVTINPPPIVVQPTPWITQLDNSMRYDGADWSCNIEWDVSKANTPTVTFEVYQNGVFKGVFASSTPNDGAERMDWTNYADITGHTYSNIQLKIISDADPSLFYMTPKFDMQINQYFKFSQVAYKGAFGTENWASGWAEVDAQTLAYTTAGAVKQFNKIS